MEGFNHERSKPYCFPEVIAHRGYKAAHPENTMAAFRGAVEAGANAIETDLHLSMDGIVVLSHDATLTRCFGEKYRISECSWSYLETLRTKCEPSQRMPRLFDLLEYVNEPGKEHVWLLLDIKRDDPADKLLQSLVKTLSSVSPTTRSWKDRILLGAWDMQWVIACFKNLQGFQVVLTTPSPAYASAMLEVPGLHFSILNYSFATERGARFRLRARDQGRNIFSWSDNTDRWMATSIRNKVDGVITDNPRRFIELCNQWPSSAARQSAYRWTLWEMIFWMGININVWFTETISAITRASPREKVFFNLKLGRMRPFEYRRIRLQLPRARWVLRAVVLLKTAPQWGHEHVGRARDFSRK
ncbi:PLC-like phosphodiesterase [Xylariaceae sp. FL0016]|nr:PLC-like phosphodiesterase [Xylariaceae sp. FL0016]